MKKEQCPICYCKLEVVICAPCHDCGDSPTEIEHFEDGKHTYFICDVYKGLTLQLCDFCRVDFGSYQSAYFGFNDNQGIGFENFGDMYPLKKPSLEKDKFCPECKRRLKFLTFLRDLRELNSDL